VAVRLRLQKTGRKNRPCYRIVAVDSRAKRDGKAIEILGVYDPLEKDDAKQAVVKRDRAAYWLGVGAQPSDTVTSIFKRLGIAKPAPAA
jgi:small subunit ribosomal protein S16